MAGSRPSRQELNRRRRRSGFIGRLGELSVFRENLNRDPAGDAFQYIFHVHGQAGVGKTSLVRQWETVARERQAVTAYLDDDVHSVIEAMETISTQLGRQQVVLKRFEKLLAVYRQRRHEAEALQIGAAGPEAAGSTAEAGQSSPASVSSMVMAQAGLAGLGMVPGLGAVAGAMDPQQLAQSTDRLRAALSARLRNHDDVQLVLSPVQVLTPVFLQDLAEAAERHDWMVLFFDVFEQTGPVLNTWLRDVLTGEEYGELPVNLVAVLSGQGRLDTRCWGDHLELVAEVPLEVFTEEEARRLLAARGVTDPDVIEVVLQLTGRLPVLVDLLAQTRPHNTGEIGDPSDTAVERFLKWETHPHRRTTALACALPLQLDEDLFRTVAPETAADEYAWLRSLPFVTGEAGRCRYHDVVRTPMLRLQRTQSPAHWQQQHTLLADTYQQRSRVLEEALTTDQHWADGAWREHRLNETYHRLCADPRQALPDALGQVIHACDQGAGALRRWSQILAQAGTDSDTTVLTAWSRSLAPPAPDADDTPLLVNALTQLLTAPQLATADQALIRCLRGREHRTANNYRQALTDYAAALALDPLLDRAHYGRGLTHLFLSRYDDALADLDRAIELNPDDGEYFADRGITHRALEHYDDALADLDRAVELAPDDALTITQRGITHRVMERYDDAVADFDRAIGLDPNDAWTTVQRGITHRVMERYDDAVADFDRAIEINDTYSLAFAQRGETHRLAGRQDEALADFDRAVELDPNDAWTIGSRGQTHHALGRYEDALTDLDRAIELNNSYVWTLNQRGETHRVMEHFDAAVADLDRAVGLDPDNAWTLAQRGEIHRLLGHFDAALADLDRAIEINNSYTWALAQRGEAHRLLGHYEEALADFDRAVELDNAYAWAIGSRGQTHRALGRYEDALTDLDRAVELDNAYAWAIAQRGITRRVLGDYDDALADLNRAIELAPGDTWALAERGESHRLLGHYEEALADFDRAVELDNAYAWAIGSRGQTHHALGRYEDALTDLDRAVELNNSYAWAIAQRGITHRVMEHFEDAVADFDRAIGLDPDDAWAHFEAAVTLRLLGDPGEHEHWRRAVAILTDEASTDGSDAIDAMGGLLVIYCALPEWDKAAEETERFLARAPQPSRVREALQDLTDLQRTLSVDPALLQPLRRRLEDAAAGGAM
ncbi:tetratricopeptide repeat protein [Streptomyces sp. NPDC058457]|uniref:tetratricopeptide repeat protein n=1 Tax=Streptomyces sp. NPDC058457 TaxID=3346507 RepID=UPI0036605B99